ncbi:MAG: glycosyltransferase family 4 protein [Chloroflexota bacterium]
MSDTDRLRRRNRELSILNTIAEALNRSECLRLMPNVLIIVQNLPVPFDRRVWLEAQTLRAAGYGVSIICPTGKKGDFQARQETLEGIHVYRYAAPPEAHDPLGYLVEFAYCWLMTAVLSLKVWRRHGFDVIHACNPPETYFLLAGLYKLLGKRFIFDHHDLSPEMYLAKGGRAGDFLHRVLLWLEKLTFRTADGVITTNASHQEIAMTRGGLPKERVFIVRSGPDFQRLQQLRPEPALKGGYPYLVCYLGEMCPQDGVAYLLQAAQLLRQEKGRADVRFVLMGGGPSLPELRRLKTTLGLDGQVEFTGRVSDHDLCRYLSTCDLCLDPDPYSEWADRSTMNKIMEYMAFGKPIVAFDLRENRYSAQGAAVYARPNDVNHFVSLIDELLKDPGRRQAMGQTGLARVHQELAWDYSRPPLLAAYQMVCSL